jgi:hypothetical protein
MASSDPASAEKDYKDLMREKEDQHKRNYSYISNYFRAVTSREGDKLSFLVQS